MNLRIPTRWVEPPPLPLPEELRREVNLPELVLSILVRRGFTNPAAIRQFLDPAGYSFADPTALPGMETAVAALTNALHAGKRIGVWGDFDVDGQTATALLVQTLRWLDAQVEYVIPVRRVASHGVHLAGLRDFLSRGVELVLTCDTGIGAVEAGQALQAAGVPFVVTDHHQLPDALPPAAALVNPQFLPPGHPLRGLCGVGTAYQLARALLREYGCEERAAELLDLVALGTLADVADLGGDNRPLVQLGLRRMSEQPRPAFQAILEQSNTAADSPMDEVIGFTIAPRLNAVGRLEDANPMVDFLLETDLHAARTTAARLEGLNAHRKMLGDQVFQAARARLQAEPQLAERAAVVLSHPNWPGGVVGIVAGRLAELLHRPVLLLTAPADGPARGSARSIEGVDITAAIAENQAYLLGFGGHPMAAGLSLPAENLPDFERALAKSVERQAGAALAVKSLSLDAFLPLEQISFELVEAIERLAPFGAGNPNLVLAARGLTLEKLSSLGRTGEHQIAEVSDDSGASQRVFWWKSSGLPVPQGKFDLAYSLRTSLYRGARQIQVEWLDYRQLEETPVEIVAPAGPNLVDRRGEQPLNDQLADLAAQPGTQLWLEDDSGTPGANRRFELGPASRLVLGSPPPGLAELHRAVEIVHPQEIILFNLPLPWVDAPAVMNRLAGLAKYVLQQRSGLASLAEMVAACAQGEQTVIEGLNWLQANGSLSVYLRDTGEVLFGPPAPPDETAKKAAWGRFTALVAETAAFRQYYARASLEALSSALRPAE